MRLIKEVSRKHKTKFISTFITLAVISLLFLAGPAKAITLGITDVSNPTPDEDSDVSFLAKVDIHTNDRIPLTNITVYVEYSNGTTVPDANITFDLNANILSSNSNPSSPFSVLKVSSTTNYDASTAGYGYGYGYNSSTGTYTNINQSFGYGYDAFDSNIKSGSGSTTAEFIYNLTWETPQVDADTEYKIKMYTTANDGSNSAKYYLKTPETITVQQVADTTPDTSSDNPSGGSSYDEYDPTESQMEEGYTETLREDDVINFDIGGSSHSLTVKEIYSNSVEIEVESTPQTAILNLGETKKFELTGDNYYDLKVTLESLTFSRADITVQSISELITEEEASEEEDVSEDTETPEETGEEETTTPETEDESNSLFWIILIVLIIVGIIGFVFWKKKE
jgi:LPXTG-motif cell wall-anchored protein